MYIAKTTKLLTWYMFLTNVENYKKFPVLNSMHFLAVKEKIFVFQEMLKNNVLLPPCEVHAQ